ncbi:MAG TPA: TonB-dependent receptor, partial [Porticoccaceae bacterium]|nr:TonB-dependent receptor [Porticoccaceae bacterium]
VTFDEVKAALSAVDAFSINRGQYVNAGNAISDEEIRSFIRAIDAPDTANSSGTILKLTLNYKPTDNLMVYGTYSEGFRPGLLNRPGGASNGTGYNVPFEVQTDEVTNIELGWKADLLDGSMRFNGNIFFVNIDDLQTTIFDPSITNLFFSDNSADAGVTGLEADLLWAPIAIDGLTLSAAVSFLDSEITKVITPTNDVRLGDELAFAPKFQGNLQARYEWDLQSGLVAHVMPHVSHSAKSYSDIIRMNRDEIGGWTLLGVTAGITSDSWSAEFFVDNLTDERAELSRNFVFDRQRVSYAMPRTTGMRFTKNF